MFSDYDFYTGEYGGSLLSKENFPYYSARAAAYIKSVSFGRVDTDNMDGHIADLVRRAECACAEIYFSAGRGAAVSSERVGNYSVTYAALSANETGRQLYSAVKCYLGNTGLLYRGDDDDGER